MLPRQLSFRARAAAGPILGLSLVLTLPAPTRGEIVRDQLWVTDGQVRAVAYTNNTVFLGGQFSNVGPSTGGVARFEGSGGALLTPYFGVAGVVNTIVADGFGGFYLGGSFTGVKGQSRNNLAHVDGSGNPTAWNPGANAEVNRIVRSGSTLYVGGYFTQLGGQPRLNLAAIDTASGVPSSWAPNPDQPVSSLHIVGSALYVGGRFTNIAGVTRRLAASFDLTTGALNAWNPDVSGSSVEVITSLGVGSPVYLGGTFSSLNSQQVPRSHIASVDPTTGVATSWAVGVIGASVNTIVPIAPEDLSLTVWIGGSFTHIEGLATPRSNIAAVNGHTAALLPFNPGTNGFVRSIIIRQSFPSGNPTTVYAAGDFTTIGGLSRPYLASMTPAGAVSNWDTRPNNAVRTMAFAPGGAVVAGGVFTSAGMTTRANIAALDATSGSITPWNPGANGAVNALLVHGSSLYVGGTFNLIGGSVRAGAAELDINTSAVSAWDPGLACDLFTCASPTVNAIARPSIGNVVYLGGDFRQAWGQIRRNMVASDGTTGAPMAFNVHANFPIFSLALRENESFPFDVLTVYAGGQFTVVNAGLHGYDNNGVTRYHLAALDGTTGAVTPWNPSPSTTVTLMALAFTSTAPVGIGTVWIGGQFPSMGGQPRNNVAAVDAGTGNATAWDPSTDAEVRALLLRPGAVYLGGEFSSVKSQPRSYLARVDAVDGTPTAWDPGVVGSVRTLACYGGTIYAGGFFSQVSNWAHPWFAGIGDGTVTAVESEPIVSRPRAVLAAPNPFGDNTTFRFALPRTEVASVAMYDVAGRLVQQLHRGVMEAGEHVVRWSGRNDRDRPVTSGIYFLRVRTPSANLSAKVFRMQ